ncbi:uncharacterized protein MYCFIDRAFT_83520 [Pseudocercospora fijiensis CIRAD86]|uniref:Major facilitator superfamily (MFS) profile domain-containing protein n=1 Tax=Pseudocercospora fijiensis (strain CIRAD86) TaxID=383855 RepID=M3AYJ7_PSEFD|nr:uncharacterized protein MYCFIDRAFT_83520 [Pseudocercospora fijiensis CIRAD86]EME82238.1 hypothetical protein MYCFIDRAFT_83520 [Pseudocercospora fijiensis CIRAD86]
MNSVLSRNLRGVYPDTETIGCILFCILHELVRWQNSASENSLRHHNDQPTSQPASSTATTKNRDDATCNDQRPVTTSAYSDPRRPANDPRTRDANDGAATVTSLATTEQEYLEYSDPRRPANDQRTRDDNDDAATVTSLAPTEQRYLEYSDPRRPANDQRTRDDNDGAATVTSLAPTEQRYLEYSDPRRPANDQRTRDDNDGAATVTSLATTEQMIAGLSWYSNHVLFVSARVFQGIGLATCLPNGLALLGELYGPGPRMRMAFADFGACAPGGRIVGSAMAGVFALAWWPWNFFSFAITLLVIAICYATPGFRIPVAADDCGCRGRSGYWSPAAQNASSMGHGDCALCALMTGSILIATVPPNQIYWAQIFVCTLVAPFGMDPSFPASVTMISDSVDKAHQGIAASLVDTIVGFAGTVEVHVNSDRGRSYADASYGYRSALYMGMGLAGLGIALAVVFLAKRCHDDSKKWRRHQNNAEDIEAQELVACQRPFSVHDSAMVPRNTVWTGAINTTLLR